MKRGISLKQLLGYVGGILALLVLAGGAAVYFANKTGAESTAAESKVIYDKTDLSVEAIWTKINETRGVNQLAPLKLNSQLNASAQAKCDDMVIKDYWSHDSPSGATPWTFISKHVPTHTKEGENLAYGHKDVQSLVDHWMASPEHKQNILDPAFTEVGYALCQSPDYVHTGQETVIVQHLLEP